MIGLTHLTTDATCVNLKDLFGDRYRVAYEESYYAERGENGRLPQPELLLIPGRVGHVFPWDHERLAVSVDGHPKIAGMVKRLSFVEVVQDGDFGELTATFLVDHFPKVADIVHLRRRRQISDEQRARIVAIGSANLERMREAKAKSQLAEQGRAQGAVVDI